ncbi:DNA polymerase III subunit delta' [Marinospirillum sp.]|uniref:DNA polymerase III subunit delta' n=1 Tax=Marinospirillum sp. TaxID=2183934 RepID=UPI003A840521
MSALHVEQKPALPLPWHATIWQQWHQQLYADRLPHALLISGEAGLGKRTLARALAHFLLCEQPQGQHPCGHCAGCQLLESGFHPDWYNLQPEAEGKAIRIDAIRDLTQRLHQSAQKGGYKVVLLWPAEALNLHAANALLKTLEEPEPATLFILVSDQPSRLPATLRSRCQHWALPIPRREDILPWLSCQLSADQQPEQLLRAAGGRPFAALKLLDTSIEQQRIELVRLMEQLTCGADPLELIAPLKKLELPWVVSSLNRWCAETLRLVMVGEAAVQDTRQMPLYQQWADCFSLQQLLAVQQELQQRQRHLQGHPNEELFLEGLVITLQRALHDE